MYYYHFVFICTWLNWIKFEREKKKFDFWHNGQLVSFEFWHKHGQNTKWAYSTVLQYTHNNTIAMARLYCMHCHNPWRHRIIITKVNYSLSLIFKSGVAQIIWQSAVHDEQRVKGDLRTICRFSLMKVYKLITLGTKFKTLLSLGRKITMFSKFITNYIEQGWWHSSLTLKCMHLLLKEVNKRGRHAYNLHGWTCLPSGIVMEIHCHITGIFEAAVWLRLPSCCSV